MTPPSLQGPDSSSITNVSGLWRNVANYPHMLKGLVIRNNTIGR